MSNFYNGGIFAARCQGSLGAMTQALKAKRLLARSGIAVEIRKLSSDERGCVYGIEYPCELLGNVRLILQSNGMEMV